MNGKKPIKPLLKELETISVIKEDLTSRLALLVMTAAYSMGLS